MYVVKLAGYENSLNPHMSTNVVKDYHAINRSLVGLSDVITAINKQSKYIPYHNSKVSSMLKYVLKPNGCKLILFIHISPLPASSSSSAAALNVGKLWKSTKIGKGYRNVSFFNPESI